MTPEQRKLRDKAAEILEIYGWTQHTYGNCKLGYCLQGALMAARKELPELQSIPIPFYYPGAIRFNDRPGRTKEEVIAVLRSDKEDMEIIKL